MESSAQGRCGEIVSDPAVALVTVAQLVFFTRFQPYIAWYARQPDGSIRRLSMLTADYSTWLPFPIAASILVFVATAVMLVYPRYWFRQAAWIGFCISGVTVVVSLVLIFPFDFSVIPNAAAVDIVPGVVTGLLILMAASYAVTALIMIARLKRHTAEQNAAKRP